MVICHLSEYHSFILPSSLSSPQPPTLLHLKILHCSRQSTRVERSLQTSASALTSLSVFQCLGISAMFLVESGSMLKVRSSLLSCLPFQQPLQVRCIIFLADGCQFSFVFACRFWKLGYEMFVMFYMPIKSVFCGSRSGLHYPTICCQPCISS